MIQTSRRVARRGVVTAGLVLMAAVAPIPASAAERDPADHGQTLDITFPVAGRVWYADDYAGWRSGGRRHQATDVFAPKGATVHATVSGVVCWMSGVDEAVPHYGYAMRLCGDDGLAYDYLHLSNDRPGTDDGEGGADAAYAPGIRRGVRVERGQHIAYVGDSGNAETTTPHLHLEIEDSRLRDPRLEPDPWRPERRNPYASLRSAQARGDVPQAPAAPADGLMRLRTPLQRGEEVRRLQQHLATLGYRGSAGAIVADGVFGPSTDHAVRAFQMDAGLDRRFLGIVGPRTTAALERAVASRGGTATPVSSPAGGTSSTWPGRYLKLTTPPMRGADVQAFQRRLVDLGYSDGAAPLSVDGVWGAQSDRVARRFIADAGLPAIAIVGPRTWNAAFRSPRG